MTDKAEAWTIGSLLTWTTDFLKERGADSPRLDAEILLAEARECQRIELYTAYAEVADERVRTAFRELVRRRAEGMPVAYLVGRKEFYSLSFRVTPDVLIPRPETEFLIVELLEIAKQQPVQRVIDVGTGSGILAVCAAKYLPEAEVWAIDISPPALALAQANAEQHEVDQRIQFHHGDLLSHVDPEQRFDVIISNPPYVSESEFDELPTDVKDFEPRIALVGGESGTELIRTLVEQAAERLNDGGHVLIEISPMICAAVVGLFESQPGWTNIRTIKDLAGLERIVAAQRSET